MFFMCVGARKKRLLCQRLYSLIWGENVSNDIPGDAQTTSNKTCDYDCVGTQKQKIECVVNKV